MSNVKPGDVAKLVPPAEINLGAHVLIISRATPEEAWEYYRRKIPSVCYWNVEALQHLSHGKVRPGEKGMACDENLRRVDPPSDSLDLTTVEIFEHFWGEEV